MDIDKIHQKVIKASLNLRDRVHKTALILSHPLSKMTGGEVYLKCENEQYTGSFKARGSLNKLLSLTSDQRIKGVITASTGNHGLGFSRACELTGSNGTVFLPENNTPSILQDIFINPRLCGCLYI